MKLTSRPLIFISPDKSSGDFLKWGEEGSGGKLIRIYKRLAS